jgi:hypothetical protein
MLQNTYAEALSHSHLMTMSTNKDLAGKVAINKAQATLQLRESTRTSRFRIFEKDDIFGL